jgi:hypothetical protein
MAGKFLATATACDSWLRRRVVGPHTDDEQSCVLDTKLVAAPARTRALVARARRVGQRRGERVDVRAEPRSRFTLLMERLVIGLIHQCSTATAPARWRAAVHFACRLGSKTCARGLYARKCVTAFCEATALWVGASRQQAR